MKSELTIDRFGTKWWKLPNGQLHRQDGPSVEYNNGSKSWWLNGIKYTEQEYKYEMRSKLTMNKDGDMFYRLPNGLRHREDGPAVELIGGYKAWYINGLRHREDGPAIEWEDGDKVWYLDDIHYTKINYKYEIRSRKLKQLFN